MKLILGNILKWINCVFISYLIRPLGRYAVCSAATRRRETTLELSAYTRLRLASRCAALY